MNAPVYVQLGWLQTAVNWVYEHSLKPLFDFVSNLLSTIISGFFEYVLLPLLEKVFGVQIEIFKAIVMNMLYNQLFRLTRVVMWALDAVENAFRTFAGLNPVYVQDANGKMQERSNEMEANMKAYDAELKKIMTEDQYKSYQADQKKMREKRRGPRHSE